MRTWIVVISALLLMLSVGAMGSSWRAQFDNYDADPDGNTNGDGGLSFFYAYLEGSGFTFDYDADTAGTVDGRSLSFLHSGGENGRGLFFGVGDAGGLDINIATQGVTVGACAKAKTLVEYMSLIAIASATDDQTAYLGWGSGNTVTLMAIGGGEARTETSTVNYLDGKYHCFTLGAKKISGSTVWDIWVDGIAQSQTQEADDETLHFYIGSLSGNDGLNTMYFGNREWNSGDQDFVLDTVGISQGYLPGWCPGPVVPEPSSLLALATGLAGLAGIAIRRRR